MHRIFQPVVVSVMKKSYLCVQLFVFLGLLIAVPAAAQPEIAKATVTQNAPIYIQPGARTPLRVAKVGTALKVLQEEGEWLEVEFNDPQFGRRVGWVQKKLVQMFRPEMEPLDLSVKEATAKPTGAGQRPASPQSLSQQTDLRPQPPSGSGLAPVWAMARSDVTSASDERTV